MIVIGMLLILVALAATALAVSGGINPAVVTFGNFQLEQTTAVFFLSGIATAVILLMGLWFANTGLDRWRRERRELKNLRKQATAAHAAQPEPAEASAASDGAPILEGRPLRVREPVGVGSSRGSTGTDTSEQPADTRQPSADASGGRPADSPSASGPTSDNDPDGSAPVVPRQGTPRHALMDDAEPSEPTRSSSS